MSIGTDLISAILDTEHSAALSEINEEWLSSEEANIYHFVRDHLRRHGVLPTFTTMRQSGHTLPNPRDVEPLAYYLEQLPRRAIHGMLRERLPNVVEMLEDRNLDPVMQELRGMLEFASFTSASQSMSSMEVQIIQIVNDYRQNRRRASQGAQGINTGYQILNELTDGFMGGDLIVLVGRPAMGKSYLLFHMLNQAWHDQNSILAVTMEMTVKQCAKRIVSLNTGVTPKMISKGEISSFKEDSFMTQIASLHSLPSVQFFAGDVKRTVADIDTIVQEFMPNILYVDSAYLLQPSGKRRYGSDHEKVAAVFEELKGIAMNRNIPVVASTQFNRDVKAGTRNIDLSMIGKSDAIGQLASIVLGVRPGAGVAGRRSRQISVIKNRDGDQIEFDTNFQFSPVRFTQIEGSSRPLGSTPTTEQRNHVRNQPYED